MARIILPVLIIMLLSINQLHSYTTDDNLTKYLLGVLEAIEKRYQEYEKVWEERIKNRIDKSKSLSFSTPSNLITNIPTGVVDKRGISLNKIINSLDMYYHCVRVLGGRYGYWDERTMTFILASPDNPKCINLMCSCETIM